MMQGSQKMGKNKEKIKGKNALKKNVQNGQNKEEIEDRIINKAQK